MREIWGQRYEDRKGRREVWRRRYREGGTGDLKLPVLDDLFTYTNIPKTWGFKTCQFQPILKLPGLDGFILGTD